MTFDFNILPHRPDSAREFAHSIEDIDAELRGDIVSLARALWAGDDRLHHERREPNGVRFGNHGSLQVTTAGPMAGVICDYKGDGKGLSPLGAIQAQLGLTKAEAVRWALDWLGWRRQSTNAAPEAGTDPGRADRRHRRFRPKTMGTNHSYYRHLCGAIPSRSPRDRWPATRRGAVPPWRF